MMVDRSEMTFSQARAVMDEINFQREKVARLTVEASRLRARTWELRGMLMDVLEYLDDQVDVVDGDYGEPAPNKAMRLVQEIKETLKRAEGE